MRICSPPNPLHAPSYLSWSRCPVRRHFGASISSRAPAAAGFLDKLLLPTGLDVAADKHGWRGMLRCNRLPQHNKRGCALARATGNDRRGLAATITDDTELFSWKRLLHIGSRRPGASPVPNDEGDWNLSAEWWGTQGGGWGNNEGDIVFHKQSAMGNGVVCVTAHPASTPKSKDWAEAEKQLQRNWQASGHASVNQLVYRIIGYEWRALRFNYVTRQSVAKVLLLSPPSDPQRLLLLQQPNCLAFEWLSAVSLAGLDLHTVTTGLQKMHILCIGLGGGSLPLYLAHNLPGAMVEAVEIDGTVISAAIDAMGYPPCRSEQKCAVDALGADGREGDESPNIIPESGGSKHDADLGKLWGGLLDRVSVYEGDGVDFVCNQQESKLYDMVFVDAYDGHDRVPYELWDVKGRFLHALKRHLHPRHGTVVVNLHSDSPPPPFHEKITGKYGPGFDPSLPQGKIVKDTCIAYRNVLVEGRVLEDSEEPNSPGTTDGLAFTVAVPWQQNIALVVSMGGAVSCLEHQTLVEGDCGRVKSSIDLLRALQSQGRAVQRLLGSPIGFAKRVARGFQLVNSSS